MIKTEKATFGAGCFWGVEEAFRKQRGVVSTAVGYAGGNVKNVTYKEVCKGKTGHAEVVQVEYNQKLISYQELLEIFLKIHNPTTLNRQGPDTGSQYRSVIFYHNELQKKEAINSKEKLDSSHKYKTPIVTEITPAGEFYKAEEYHQQYLEKNGGSSCHI